MAFKEAQILFTGALVVEVLYDKTCDYLHKLDFSDKTTSAHIAFSFSVHLYWFCCCIRELFPENGRRRNSTGIESSRYATESSRYSLCMVKKFVSGIDTVFKNNFDH